MSSTRHPAGVLTNNTASLHAIGLASLSTYSSLTTQRPLAASPLHVPTVTELAPSNIDVKISPSRRGGESLFALANRLSAASALPSNCSSAGDRNGAYFARSAAEGMPSDG